MKNHKKNKILEDYKNKQLAGKAHIRFERSKGKRFLKWIGYFIAFPFVGTFYNIRDWRTALIFAVVIVVLSSEVWVPYLLGIIFRNNGLLGIGTACGLFGLGPGTPFMVICIGLTIAIKGLFNKIKEKNNGH